MRNAVVLPALLIALVVAAPAAAADYVPVIESQRVYFQCGASRVANSGDPATWSTEEPTGATPFGGCMQWDIGGRHDDLPTGDRQDATFVGTFTGNLDSLTLHAYAVWTGTTRVCICSEKSIPVQVELHIDGTPMLGRGVIVNVQRGGTATVLDSVQISVTDLGFLAEEDAGTHTVELSLDPGPLNVAVWRYGSSDVPAGIEFNPPNPAIAKVARIR